MTAAAVWSMCKPGTFGSVQRSVLIHAKDPNSGSEVFRSCPKNGTCRAKGSSGASRATKADVLPCIACNVCSASHSYSVNCTLAAWTYSHLLCRKRTLHKQECYCWGMFLQRDGSLPPISACGKCRQATSARSWPCRAIGPAAACAAPLGLNTHPIAHACQPPRVRCTLSHSCHSHATHMTRPETMMQGWF